MVAEETVAAGRIPTLDDGPFWLVDPLDGTKEFISRNGEFTVNIALIEGREPVLGVVLAPALGKVWWGARGHGAMARDGEDGAPRRIAVRPKPATPGRGREPLAFRPADRGVSGRGRAWRSGSRPAAR